MRRSLVACLLVGLGGCLVSPVEETVRITLGLDLPPDVAGATFAQGVSPWDEQQRFRLTVFPKYVRVAVEYQDYELAYATWPDPQRGIGDGEGDLGQVGVTLDVPAGSDRELQVLGYVTDLDRVLVYGTSQPVVLDLVAGQNEDLTLDTVLLPTGHIDMTVRCQQGNTGDWMPDRVMLWDARAGVLFPPLTLKQVSPTGGLGVEISAVPVGRQFWVRVMLRNVKTGAESFIELRSFFGVVQPNETRPVNVVIPCSIAG